MESTNDYIKRRFGVDEQKFVEVMKMSPGAEGYIHGSLSELLFNNSKTIEIYSSLNYRFLQDTIQI